jgi:hypothetical protein
MKYVAAAVLFILGVGIFPYKLRVLFTSGGLVLFALSAALLFFAYRIATHKSKE